MAVNGTQQETDRVDHMDIKESRYVIYSQSHWKLVIVNLVYVYPPIQLAVVADDLPMQTNMHGRCTIRILLWSRDLGTLSQDQQGFECGGDVDGES